VHPVLLSFSYSICFIFPSVFVCLSISQASGKAFTDPAGSLVKTRGREAVKQRWNDRCPKRLVGQTGLIVNLIFKDRKRTLGRC